MRRAYQQILGSIAATVILTLLALTPVWIADTLEPLEVEQQDLIPAEVVISDSIARLEYSPYVELNTTTQGHYYDNGNWFGSYSYTVPGTKEGPDTKTYNIDGFEDYLFYSPPGVDYIYLMVNVDWGQVQTDNADIIYIYFNTTENINLEIYSIRATFTDGTYAYSNHVDITGFDTSIRSMYIQDSFTINSATLNNIGTMASSYTGDHELLLITFHLIDTSTDANFYHDIQISPQYYEESTTTWNNQTVTTYEPYIQAFSNPHVWQQWTLGTVGILFIATAAVINPIINPSKLLGRGRIKTPWRR